MKSLIFQISNWKIWRISALKVYLKLNQKVVGAKKLGQIVLYIEIFNFKTVRAAILQIFELLIWKINDFINSFRLYLPIRNDWENFSCFCAFLEYLNFKLQNFHNICSFVFCFFVPYMLCNITFESQFLYLDFASRINL